MNIGNLIINDKWVVKQSGYEKSITFLPERYSVHIFILCLDHNEWIISFPCSIPMLFENYKNMFNVDEAFISADGAKQRVDLFLNKLIKLKAFL